MITLKNNTRATSKFGYLVTIDPQDPNGFVYASPTSTSCVGVVVDAVPYKALCRVATTGEIAKVYTTDRVASGDILRLAKSVDNESAGVAVIAKSNDTPYLRIGKTLQSGSRDLVSCLLDIQYIYSTSTGSFQPLNTNLTTLSGYSSALIGYLDATSSIQDQIDGKIALADIPIASDTVLGMIKVGTNLTIDENGVLNGDGGAGSANWGSIGGTIGAQTDLQTALGLKAPLASPSFTGTVSVTGTGTLDLTQRGQGRKAYFTEHSDNIDENHENYILVGGYSGTSANPLSLGHHYNVAGSYAYVEMLGGTRAIKLWTSGHAAFGRGVHVGGESDPGDNNLQVDGFAVTAGGVHVGGTSDPGTDNLIVDGTSTFVGDLGTASFASGFAGSGWKLDEASGKYNLTVDNLTVREALTAYELNINKISSINGGLVISVANGTALNVSGTTIYFDEDGTNKQIQFVVNDYVRAQHWTGRTAVSAGGISKYIGLVTNVVHSPTYGSAYIVCTTIEGTPWNGMELVQIGNSSTASRQNLIYLTASDTNNPYIDMLAGVDDGSFTGKQVLRIGNLSGINDATLGGALTGYGLYADNVYLKGKIVADSGSIGGWTIDSTSLHSNFMVGMSSYDVGTDDHVRFWAGALWPNPAPFMVTESGDMTALGVVEIGTNTAVVDGKISNVAIKESDIWENSYNGDGSALQFNYKGYNGGSDYYRDVIFYNGRGADGTYTKKMLTIIGESNRVDIGNTTAGRDVDFFVYGDTTLRTLTATGAIEGDSTLGIDGATTLRSTLGVTGATTLNSSVTINGTSSFLLLPRMNTTQRDALSAVNGMMIYNSGGQFQVYVQGEWKNISVN